MVDADRLAIEAGISVPAVRTAISRLRRQFGDAVVATVGREYALGGITVDADRFREAARRARSAHGPDRISLLATALELWTGTAYGEYADREWAQAESEGLEELRSAVVEDHAEQLILLGQCVDAIARLDRHVAEFPFRDRPRGLLMRALAAEGRQTEALRTFQDYRRMLAEDAGTTPGAELVELDRHIAAGWSDLAPTELSRPTRVASLAIRRPPSFSSEFIGRIREVERVVDALETNRLVTLTGVGGVGKTRLAIEASRLSSDQFDDGVVFVDLAPASDRRSVLESILGALGEVIPAEPTVEGNVLPAFGRLNAIVLVDNCEHVVDHVAHVVSDVLLLDSQVRMLATSREALGLSGERRIAIDGLELRSHGAARSDAATLFTACATARDDRFTVDPALAESIEALCKRLDGLPLALELAASQLPTLSVDQILELLAGRSGSLPNRTRTIARHETLQDAIAWSHDLLDEAEQRAFARLSVFAGTFGLPGAAAVLEVDDRRARGLVGSLVNKSLLVVDRGASEHRYRYLETIRDDAERRLEVRGERDRTMRALSNYLRMWAAECASGLATAEPERSVELRDALVPTVRRSVDWAVAQRDVTTVIDLLAPFGEIGFIGADRIGSMAGPCLEAFGDVDHDRWSRIISLAAAHEVFAAGPAVAAILSERAVAAWVPAASPRPIELVVHHSTIGLIHDRLQEAAEVAARGAELAEQLDDPISLVPCLAGLALWKNALGEQGCEEIARRAFDTARRHGNPSLVAAGAYSYSVLARSSAPRRALDVARAGAASAARVADSTYETLEVEVCANLLALGRDEQFVAYARDLLGIFRTEACRLELLVGLVPHLIVQGHRDVAQLIVERAPGAARIETLYQDMWSAAAAALERANEPTPLDFARSPVDTDALVGRVLELLQAESHADATGSVTAHGVQ